MTSQATDPISPGSVHVIPDFYTMADRLRQELDSNLFPKDGVEVGLTSLRYAFYEQHYQFLTASADRIFTEPALDGFMSRLRAYATEQFDISRVSTPQIRCFIQESRRELFLEEITASWRYSFCIKEPVGKGRSYIRILDQHPTQAMKPGQILRYENRYNTLFITDATLPYGIDCRISSFNPLEGAIFLDGYLW